MEVAWCLFDSYRYDECVGGCHTTTYGLALEKGEKRITLKRRERAIITLNRDELKPSTTSSLLSPPVRQLSFCLNRRHDLRILRMSSYLCPVPSACRLPSN